MSQYANLLTLTLEIEGCLRILEVRDDDTVKQMLTDKINRLLALSSDTCPSDLDIQFNQAIDDVIPPVSTSDTTQPSVESELEPQPEPEPVAEPKPTAEPQSEPEPTPQPEPEPQSDPDPTPQPEPKMQVEPKVQQQNFIPQQDALRVEDVISQRGLSDFSKAFTINDRFRFIRELFNGDAEQFKDAIRRLDQMESLGDAYDYFLNDLGWDADNEAVSDYIAIVATHFNSSPSL